MALQLSQFAKGLLDLVGLQNFGENPRELSPVVVPTVDIGEQYQVQLLRPVALPIADILVGSNSGTTLTVPAGEVWCLKQAAAGAVTDAAEAIAFNVAVQIEGNSYALGPLVTLAASVSGLSVSLYQNLWLPAGAAIGVFCQSKTGTVNGTVTAMFTRLRA
jgi:hypothetical protein